MFFFMSEGNLMQSYIKSFEKLGAHLGGTMLHAIAQV